MCTVHGDFGDLPSVILSQAKVDRIVGAECLYCGDRMIQSIDQPFIPREKFDLALKSWM